MSLDPVVLNFTEATYREPLQDTTRYWPIDQYPTTRLGPIEEAASAFHYLRVPLLGQHIPNQHPGRANGRTGLPQWCGRTAAAMAYNYHQLLEGGDPRERYISQWNGDNADWCVDLRMPNGERAFHKDVDQHHEAQRAGARTRWFADPDRYDWGYGSRALWGFPGDDMAARAAEAARIEADDYLVAQALEHVLGSIRAGHPVVAYTRLSHTRYRQHIVLFCGSFWIPDAEGESLWILVADPSTGAPYMRHAKAPGDDPSQWTREHCYYPIVRGAWNAAKGSLYLLRASFLFRDYVTALEAAPTPSSKGYVAPPGPPGKPDTHRLVLDCSDLLGGVAYCSTKKIELIPPGLVASKHDYRPPQYRFVTMPFKRGKQPVGPVDGLYANESGHGGYFPVGLRRNLHSGLHLMPPPAEVASAPPEGEPPPPATPAWPAAVHCVAPGYVVAARLPGYDAPGYQLLGNHLGFVLVRHEFQPVGQEDPPTHALYSLYMHLTPPGWSALEGDRYQGVGWFQQLSSLRHGQVVAANSPTHTPGTCWWAAQEVEGVQVSGTLPTLPPSGGELEVDLGAPATVCAVVRPPPADVSQALDALRAGDVATFSQPLLAVEAGEAIGFVEPHTACLDIPSGFLDWEMFAPAEAGVTELLRLAQDALGLTFPAPVEAAEPENRYDGQQLTEKLKALLPEAEREPVCGQEADGKDGLFGVWNFERPLLKLASRRSVYAFAAQGTDDAEWSGREAGEPLTVADAVAEARAEAADGVASPPAAPGELTYPLTLEIENFAGAAWDPSAAPVTLKVRFEPEDLAQEGTVTLDQAGDVWTFTIQVPAAATKIHLEADGFHIDRQLEPPAALDHQQAALQALLPHRWRNVVLRRSSDMSLPAIEEAVRARFEYLADLEPYYRNLAWWAPGAEPAEGQPQEVAVCGDGASLFGGDGLLPDAEGALDYVHPIAGAWLLNTLLVAEQVRLVTGWEPVLADGAPDEPVHFGWLTFGGDPEQLAYGARVSALVVLRSYGVGDAAPQVTFVVKREGADPIELGPVRADGGIAALPARFPGWGGPWTLEIKGHEGVTSEAPLPSQVTIARPEIGTVGAPTRHEDGGFRWRIPFTAHAPSQLEAWVTIRTATVSAGDTGAPSWAEAAFSVPVLAVRIAADERAFDEDGLRFDASGEFITGHRGSVRLPNPDGDATTDFFLASEFFGLTPEPQQVSRKAIELVNHVRKEYGSGLEVLSVGADGLSIVFRKWGTASDAAVEAVLEAARAALDTLQAGEQGTSWEGCAVSARAGEEAVEARVPAPQVDVPGTLVAEFSPAEALRRLHVEQVDGLGEGEALAVSFGLFAPNGGWFGAGGDEEEVGAVVVDKGRADLDSASGGELLGGWAAGPSVHLVKVSFGPLHFELGRDAVTVTVGLCGGTYDEWRDARPKVSLGGEARGAVQRLENHTGQGRERAVVAQLQATFPTADLGGEKTFEVKTGADTVTFAGVECSVPGRSEQVDTTPRLEEAQVLDPSPKEGKVAVVCRAPWVPTSKGVRVRVLKEGQEVEALSEAARFAEPNGYFDGQRRWREISASGCPDEAGRIEVEWERAAFAAPFPREDGGTQDFEVVFYRPEDWGAPALDPLRCSGTLAPDPLHDVQEGDMGQLMKSD